MSAGIPLPTIVAHRAGNDVDSLRKAAAACADYAEADVWLSGGRLEVRHGRIGAGWIPGRKRPLLLGELFDAEVSCGLLLDLKGTNEELPAALYDAIVSAQASNRVAASGRWEHLDRLADLLPTVPRFYTVDSAARLEGLRSRLERRRILALSIDKGLLTGALVLELRRCGVKTLLAWTVKTEAEAYELLDRGADGLTVDSLSLVSKIRGALQQRQRLN